MRQNILRVLESSDEIESVKLFSHFIIVKFKRTGVSEYWTFKDEMLSQYKSVKIPENPLNFVKPQIFRQFAVNPYYKEEFDILRNHFIIPQSSITKAGFIQVRYMLHQVTASLYEQGWVDLAYTDDLLKDDYEKFEADLGKHQSSLIRFRVFPYYKRVSGLKLLYHFTPIARGAYMGWKSMNRIHTAMDNMIKGGYRDITRESLVFALNRFRITPPNFWKSVLMSWCDVGNADIIDFYPLSGSKALATSYLNGNYHHNRPILNNHLNNMVDYLGLPKIQTDCKKYYDYAFLSRHKPLDKEIAEKRIAKHQHRAKYCLIMVRQEDKKYFTEKYKIHRVLRINRGVAHSVNLDDYLLIIGQR